MSVPDRAGNGGLRVDLLLIADMVEPGSSLLDVGCGDGTLLGYLARHKEVDGRGIELSQAGVNACVSQGLSAVQGDADTDLQDYPDGAFEYVILSQTLPAIRQPKKVLLEMMRIGNRAIVSFPNFGHWRARFSLLLTGRMPVTDNLPHQWYDTPNIHLCTIKDFVILCDELGIGIERRLSLDSHGKIGRFHGTGRFANLFGEQAVFLLKKG